MRDITSGGRVQDQLRLLDLLTFDSEAFLAQAYLRVLGRSIDGSGFTGYLRRLSQGESKARILWEIINSSESRARLEDQRELLALILDRPYLLWTTTDSSLRVREILAYEREELIEAAYWTSQGRLPTSQERNAAVETLATGTPRLEALERITNGSLSPTGSTEQPSEPGLSESTPRDGTQPPVQPRLSVDDLLKLEDIDFVSALYEQVLGRYADLPGLTGFLHQFRAGSSKETMIAKFALSTEGRRASVSIYGLRSIVFRHLVTRVWIIGPVIRAIIGGNSESSRDRLFRKIDRKLTRIDEMMRRDKKTQETIALELDELIARRAKFDD